MERERYIVGFCSLAMLMLIVSGAPAVVGVILLGLIALCTWLLVQVPVLTITISYRIKYQEFKSEV